MSECVGCWVPRVGVSPHRLLVAPHEDTASFRAGNLGENAGEFASQTERRPTTSTTTL